MTGLHPLIVHFPIALLCVAFGLELAGQIGKKPELSRVAWWNQLIGTCFLVGAVLTGLYARQNAHLSDAAGEILNIHQQAAFFATALFAGLLLWRIGARTSIPNENRRLYLLAFTVATGILLLVAWYGGELVHRYHAGVTSSLP